jgi:hypothetical protein
MDKIDIARVRSEHKNEIFQLDKAQFQALCTCGWTSLIEDFEHVDLVRALHAHAVVTFLAYQG